MVYAQLGICSGEWHEQAPLGFWDTNGLPNLGQTSRPYHNQQKRENLQDCGFCCPSGPQSKIERMRKVEKVSRPR